MLILSMSSLSFAQLLTGPYEDVYSPVYEVLTPASSQAAFLTQANAQGQRGFRYVGDNAFGSPGPTITSSVYVRDSLRPATYAYETLAPAANSAAFLEQANAQGARGYRFEGNLVKAGATFPIYMKDESGAATFIYQMSEPGGLEGALRLARSLGPSSFQFWGFLYFERSAGVFSESALYVKDSRKVGRLTLQWGVRNADLQTHLAFLNAMGARGFRVFVEQALDSSGATTVTSFIRDSASRKRYRYEALAAASSPSAFLMQANAQSARRFAYLGTNAFGDSLNPVVSSIYMSVLGTDGNASDLAGDGISSILAESSDGSTTAFLRTSSSTLYSNLLIGAGSGWTVSHTGDFDGDGRADILWRHTDGSSVLWLMDGPRVDRGGGLLGPGSGWAITHVADLNGDSKDDIVLRHTDGRIVLWLMDGTSILSGTALIGSGTGWTVTHTGDFNGDGRADLLWSHPDGTSAVWLMNGASLLSGAGLIGPGGWRVSVVADLDGNGTSDIVWRNTDGTLAAWLMNGTTLTAGVGYGGPGNQWAVTHAGDLNGDCKADLLLRHADGTVVSWIMDGLMITDGGPERGAGWSLQAVRDFFGYGKADLLWRNETPGFTGRLAIGSTWLTGLGYTYVPQ